MQEETTPTTQEEIQQPKEQQVSRTHSFRTIQIGDTIVIRTNDGNSIVYQNIKQGATMRLFKTNVKLDSLLDQPYNAFFEFDKTSKLFTLMTTNPDPEPLYIEEEEKQDLENNNRELVDDNQAQQLTSEEISALKQVSSSGKEIIEKLVENSASFDKRHTFSKHKYLKKKKQKYLSYIKVLPPTVQEIASSYMDKKADKISNLRFDALSQLLYHGNVYSNTQVIVAESCMGLVTAAVLERMNGYGRILKVADNPSSQIHIAKLMAHLPDRSVVNNEPMIVHIPFTLIGKLLQSNQENGSVEALSSNESNEQQQQAAQMDIDEDKQTVATETNNTSSEQQPEDVEMNEAQLKKQQQKEQQQRQRQQQEERCIQLLQHKSDSLIIAGNHYDPETFLVNLWPYLQNSGSFAIHCSYLQPLQKCYNMLRSKNENKTMNAVMVNLSETWTREQQVLPFRTHPVMRMHATSGYILSGIKVE